MSSGSKIYVGLVGYKRSGKDTVFRLIKERHPSAFRVAFADAVKEEVSAATGVSVEQIEEQKDRFRLLLQTWATEFRREDDPDYWLKRAAEKARAADTDLVVFTDVRFPNEAAWIREKGGTLVHVRRPRSDDFPDQHSSERHVSEITADYWVDNSGGIAALGKAVDGLLEWLGEYYYL